MSLKLAVSEITKNGNNVYFIAEIGQNHQGSLDLAKEMIKQAKISGANCAKFQKSCLKAKFTESALNRRYDSINSWGQTYGDHKRYLEFDLDEYKELQRFSNEIGIDFTASAMDDVSLEQLNSINTPFIKIGSGDTNNFPLLKKAAKLKRPLLISTGMQHMSTIDRVVEIMRSENKTDFALLHCVSSYPTNPSDCNLQLIQIFKRKYPEILIGYSGHELGIDISLAAVLLGARIIERHFTLDKSMKGSDHMCSLLPDEFKKLTETVKQFRDQGFLDNQELDAQNVSKIIGNSEEVQSAFKYVTEKVIMPCEESCKSKLGKTIVASRNLNCGHTLLEDDMLIKVSEPNGIPAEKYEEIIGLVLTSNVMEDCPIQYEHIK